MSESSSSVISTLTTQTPTSDQVPTPLLAGFLIVVVVLLGILAVAPRRVIKWLWLGNPAIDQMGPTEMRTMRIATGILAVWLLFLLVRWKVSGVLPF